MDAAGIANHGSPWFLVSAIAWERGHPSREQKLWLAANLGSVSNVRTMSMSLYNHTRMSLDRMRLSLMIMFLFLAGALVASAEDVTVSTAIVPVVGAVRGLEGIEWRTDVALLNQTTYDVEVVLTLPGVPDDPFFFTTIPAGGTITLPDVARSTFGVVGRLSPLRVTTVGPSSVAVAAVVHGNTREGPVDPQVLTVQYGENRSMLEALTGLTFNETFRTNLGLVNPTDDEALIVLALQKIAGRNIAIVRQSIPPRTHVQLPMQSFFPLLAEGENLTIVVEHTNPGAYVYASVISNATGNARYYGPR